jgi:hypothetical protein
VVVEVVIYCVVVVPDFGDGIDSPLGRYLGTDVSGKKTQFASCSAEFEIRVVSRIFKSCCATTVYFRRSPPCPQGFPCGPPVPPLKRNPGPEEITRSPNFPSDTAASHLV